MPPDAVARPRFPPLDQAVVKATACELVAQTKQPLSRQSLADVTARVRQALGKPISRSTVWRILDGDAIKPWQYKYWIFPRDPRFVEKAGPILDLYAGCWEGQPLGPKDHILSADEKTSIQARARIHPPLPCEPGQPTRVEPEYKRGGAWQYLAAWDVRRGYIMGRCEAKTGIAPFGRLVEQVLAQEPYRSAERLFWVVDNGSSHRGASGGAPPARGGCSDSPGTYAGTRELAQPGGDLLLDHPAEGADAQRLRGPGSAAAAAGLVRRVVQPQPQAIRLEIRPCQAGRLDGQDRSP